MWTGNLRKMTTSDIRRENGKHQVHYKMPLADVIEPSETLAPEDWIGHHVSIKWTGEIHCAETGKRIKKTYGDGLSYNAWLASPASVPSVIRPELSRIHEGIALRDEAWERTHHLAPHYVYISYTGGLKVGVTRTTNMPYRWHDQGATAAIVVAEVPYRQLAGLMEVELKPVFGDKTNYRAMLKHQAPDAEALLEAKDEALDALGETHETFFSDVDEVREMAYPVLNYPAKISSVRLDKVPEIQAKLVGIKGQYLLFDSGQALNLRNHIGYRVEIAAMS